MYLTRSSMALWRYKRCICAEALWSRPENLKHSSLSYKIFQNMHLQIFNVLKMPVLKSMNGNCGEGQMLVCMYVCMHVVICGISLGQWRAGARVYVERPGIITWPRERERRRVCVSVCLCVCMCGATGADHSKHTWTRMCTRSRTGEHHSKAAD